MIRAATYMDVDKIVALLQAVYRSSIYVKYGDVDAIAAESIVRQMIGLMGALGSTSSMIWVSEDGDRITGLIVGMKQPTYFIGTTRTVQEMFYVGARGVVKPRDMIDLYGRFLNWALSDDKVIEIKSSSTDVFEWVDWRELRPFFDRRGFEIAGEVFVRRIQK